MKKSEASRSPHAREEEERPRRQQRSSTDVAKTMKDGGRSHSKQSRQSNDTHNSNGGDKKNFSSRGGEVARKVSKLKLVLDSQHKGGKYRAESGSIADSQYDNQSLKNSKGSSSQVRSRSKIMGDLENMASRKKVITSPSTLARPKYSKQLMSQINQGSADRAKIIFAKKMSPMPPHETSNELCFSKQSITHQNRMSEDGPSFNFMQHNNHHLENGMRKTVPSPSKEEYMNRSPKLQNSKGKPRHEGQAYVKKSGSRVQPVVVSRSTISENRDLKRSQEYIDESGLGGSRKRLEEEDHLNNNDEYPHFSELGQSGQFKGLSLVPQLTAMSSRARVTGHFVDDNRTTEGNFIESTFGATGSLNLKEEGESDPDLSQSLLHKDIRFRPPAPSSSPKIEGIPKFQKTFPAQMYSPSTNWGSDAKLRDSKDNISVARDKIKNILELQAANGGFDLNLKDFRNANRSQTPILNNHSHMKSSLMNSTQAIGQNSVESIPGRSILRSAKGNSSTFLRNLSSESKKKGLSHCAQIQKPSISKLEILKILRLHKQLQERVHKLETKFRQDQQ